MGIVLGGSKHGVMAEMNVVPLIDILLVLLIIFMVISPRIPVGLGVVLPEPATTTVTHVEPDVVVVQVLADGSLRINEDPVRWPDLASRLETIFKLRASRVAFVRGDSSVEFGVVARTIGVMRGAGIDTVGLMTAELANRR